MPTTYAIPNGRTVMDATTYTGNGSTQSINNSDLGTTGFKPDLVWVKDRSNANNHWLVDSVRGSSGGVYATLFSNLTSAEQTTNSGSETSYGIVSAINSNGFTVAPGSVNAGATNFSGHTYVAWQWQAGQGTTSSNTSGSITSTVSVNASAGFSIVTYTTTAGIKTVGHGLGVAPKLIIVKPRAVTADWYVYNANIANTQYLKLNTTDAVITDTNLWNSTSPTSSVFTLGSSWGAGNTMVAYCWSEVAGFSKFGSYTGNGSADGPFVYLGFRPKFVMYKSSSGTDDWKILDSTRSSFNQATLALYPDLSNAEDNSTLFANDFLSNGFKLRTSWVGFNNSGTTYIYMAFAENPFKYANAR